MKIKHALLALLIAAMTTVNAAEKWGTAVATGKSGAIVFRFLATPPTAAHRTARGDRAIVVWKYASASGMPSPDETARMAELEDTLHTALVADGFATLVLVSTGDGFREWIYYAKSETQFMQRLNAALRTKVYPLEIHTEKDPKWTSYEAFLRERK